MENESKTFTLKPAVAAMSGAIIAVLGILLSKDSVSDSLSYSIIFAAISLPALAALPIFDAHRENNKYFNAAFGIAGLLGFGGFILFVAAIIFSFSQLAGFIFVAFSILWEILFLIIKKYESNESS